MERGVCVSARAVPPRGRPTIREPPVLTAWADNPAIVRLIGAAGRSRTTPTGWLRDGGAAGYSSKAKDNHRGLSLRFRFARHRQSDNGAHICAPYGRV